MSSVFQNMAASNAFMHCSSETTFVVTFAERKKVFLPEVKWCACLCLLQSKKIMPGNNQGLALHCLSQEL